METSVSQGSGDVYAIFNCPQPQLSETGSPKSSGFANLNASKLSLAGKIRPPYTGRHRKGYELNFNEGCEELNTLFHEKFEEYDTNGGGTIDSEKEMNQLTLNLISTLDSDGKHMSYFRSKERRQEVMRGFEGDVLSNHPLTFEEYIVWFVFEVLDKYYAFVEQEQEDEEDEEDEDETEFEERVAHADVKAMYIWRALEPPPAPWASGTEQGWHHQETGGEGSAVHMSNEEPNIAVVLPVRDYKEPEPAPDFVPRVEQEIPDNAKKKDGHCCDNAVEQAVRDCAVM